MSSVDPRTPQRANGPAQPSLMPPPVAANTVQPPASPPQFSPMAPYVPSGGLPSPAPASSAPGVARIVENIVLPNVTQRAAQSSGRKNPPSSRPVVGQSVAAPVIADGEEPQDLAESAYKSAPPFLVSMLVHMALVIVLALITFGRVRPHQIELTAVYNDTRGLQLLDDRLQSPEMLEIQTLDPLLAVDVTPVENPFAAPNVSATAPNALHSASTIEAPAIGHALTGREAGLKKVLLPIYGGTPTTEAAVIAGLEWLKRQQMRDGGWSLVGPYPEGGQFENRCAATAMALLAFQGYGSTHRDSGGQTPDFHDVVDRGWNFLLKMQDKDGQFVHETMQNQRTYAQAQATIAICEIYGMTKDEKFKRPAQLALDFAHKAQAQEGGWRYEPRVDSDVSVTGWYVMALQSGLMAGLQVQSPTLNAVSEFLDKASLEDGTRYSYTIGGKPDLVMTAEAILCRQYLGWKRDDPRMRAAIDYVLANRINYDEDMNVYYWYYATQACHHMDGEDWNRWNEVLREKVPAAQIKTGSNRGSWNPSADRWGAHGGRLYVTCLSVFMLESYYRHLPIYQWRLK